MHVASFYSIASGDEPYSKCVLIATEIDSGLVSEEWYWRPLQRLDCDITEGLELHCWISQRDCIDTRCVYVLLLAYLLTHSEIPADFERSHICLCSTGSFQHIIERDHGLQVKLFVKWHLTALSWTAQILSSIDPPILLTTRYLHLVAEARRFDLEDVNLRLVICIIEEKNWTCCYCCTGNCLQDVYTDILHLYIGEYEYCDTRAVHVSMQRQIYGPSQFQFAQFWWKVCSIAEGLHCCCMPKQCHKMEAALFQMYWPWTVGRERPGSE